MFSARTLVGVGVVLGVAACSARPPPRLAVELTARASAKAGVVRLVVADPIRAERLRAIYLEVTRLGRELDRTRVEVRTQCSAGAESRGVRLVASDPIGSGRLSCLIAPPLGDNRALLDHYARLMREARSLLTQREFERLERVR